MWSYLRMSTNQMHCLRFTIYDLNFRNTIPGTKMKLMMIFEKNYEYLFKKLFTIEDNEIDIWKG